MTTTRPKARGADAPPDDSIEPALTTPRRLAAELERIATELGRQQYRLRRLAAYCDHSAFGGLADLLGDVADGIAGLGGSVLVGKVPIVAGRDERAGRDRYPLLERPAANGTTATPAREATPIGDLDLPDWVSGPLQQRGYRTAGELAAFADGCDDPSEVAIAKIWGPRKGPRARAIVAEALAKLREPSHAD